MCVMDTDIGPAFTNMYMHGVYACTRVCVALHYATCIQWFLDGTLINADTRTHARTHASMHACTHMYTHTHTHCYTAILACGGGAIHYGSTGIGGWGGRWVGGAVDAWAEVAGGVVDVLFPLLQIRPIVYEPFTAREAMKHEWVQFTSHVHTHTHFTPSCRMRHMHTLL